MTRNKCKKVSTAVQLVVLMKILCYRVFVCSNRHFNAKSTNEKCDTGYNVRFLFLFILSSIDVLDFTLYCHFAFK